MAGFDPITLQILWNRLVGIVDEAAITLVRTSFSQVVQECNDYSCTIMDAQGRALADNPLSIPAFVGTLPRTMRHMLEKLPRETWKPGDVVVTNDPWMGTGHLLDFTLVSPVFHKGRLVAFMGSVAHAVDVGGVSWGSHARDVFEEGIRIPIARLVEEGRPNRLLFEVIRSNVRAPDLVEGDHLAQIAAIETGTRRTQEFLDEAGLDDLEALAEAIQTHAEQSMRAAIRAVPDGVYDHAQTIDGYDGPLTVKARLTIAGDTLDMDYAGSSPQVARGINSVMNYTFAYTAYPLKCALDPLTPKNEGSYRPMTIRAPEGTIFNPRFPAPVSARHLVGMYCAAAAFGCLSQAIPDRVMAESSGPPARPVFRGTGSDGLPYALIMFPWGGMGARSAQDGLACTAYPGNDNCASVEITEAAAPVRFRRKQVIADSGGAGQFQGGGGQEITLDYVSAEPGTLALMSARFATPAQGLLGGGPGTLTGFTVNGEARPQNGLHDVRPGDTITFRYPGGGGYGDAARRAPQAVARDVRDGILTAAHADAAYGTSWRAHAS